MIFPPLYRHCEAATADEAICSNKGKQSFLLIVILLCSLFTKAQETKRFSRLYDYDNTVNSAFSVIELKGEGCLFASDAWDLEDEDTLGRTVTYLRILKTDLNGDTVWTRLYQKRYFSLLAPVIVPCLDTNYFMITGRIYDLVQNDQNGNNEDADHFFAKINRNGDTLWMRTLKYSDWGEYPLQIIPMADGGFLTMGQLVNPDNTHWEMLLLKVDSNGSKVWDQKYTGSYTYSSPYPHSLTQTSDKGYAIFGWSKNAGLEEVEALLIKTDSLGNEQWRKTYGEDTLTEFGMGIFQTKDGGYILSGDKGEPKNEFGDFIDRGWIMKTDSLGAVIWEKVIRREDHYCYFHHAIELPDGSIVAFGNRQSDDPAQNNVGWLVKFDNEGNLIWERKYGEPYDSVYAYYPTRICADLERIQDNGFIMSGQGTKGFGHSDSWLLKVDSFGCLQPDCQLSDGIQWIHDQRKAALFPPYPNPANGIVNLNCYIPESLKNGQLFLYDLMGKQVAAYELHAGYSNFSFDTQEIPAGLYSVILYTQGQPVQSRKIVVAK